MPNLTTSQFNQFINPQSIVIVGASEKTGPGSYNLMENLINDGCSIKMYPVNVRADKVMGQKAYRSILDLPEPVDLAVITIPRTAVPGAVAECVQKGIKAILVVTQGFADADAEGQNMQEEILEIIKDTGTRLIGPNSIGLANAFDNFHTSFQKFDLYQKANAMICQSGMFVLASADFIQGLGIGVDIGNGADVNFSDLLPCLADDSRIKVINLHMEGISNGEEFLQTAARITPEKPVLVYKVGKSEAGAKAAASHSGSLAGEDRVFDAAFKKAGIMRVKHLDEMNDLNKAFLTYPGIRGKRFAVITLSGGGGIAVVDALGAYGFEIASPGEGVMEDIQAMNPPWLKVGNPVDTWMAVLKKGLAGATVEILKLLLDDDGVDGAIVLLNCYKATGYESLADMVDGIVQAASENREKPVALWAFGDNQHEVINKAERSGGVAGFPTPKRAPGAREAFYHYHHFIRNRPLDLSMEFPDVKPKVVSDILAKTGADGVSVLGSETLEILDAYGIPTAVARFAGDKAEAVRTAKKIGYPLVMKIASAQAVHKSDMGGVILNIKNDAELVESLEKIISNVKSKLPEAVIDGVFLQKYQPEGVEIIIGSKWYDDFGPLIVFGLGGIYTEILKDVSFALAPVTRMEARRMIGEIQAKAILEGARGGPRVRMECIEDTLMRVSRLATDFPQIKELDINPLVVNAENILALDTRAVL